MAEKKAPKGPQQYRGNLEHSWEEAATYTYRLRVPGGWLYRYANDGAMAFVPVPEAVGYKV